MPSTHKKVIVRKMDRDSVNGYVAPANFVVDEFENTRVRGRASGEPLDNNKHPHRIVVKAATYHQLRLERSAGEWRADVFLDI